MTLLILLLLLIDPETKKMQIESNLLDLDAPIDNLGMEPIVLLSWIGTATATTSIAHQSLLKLNLCIINPS